MPRHVSSRMSSTPESTWRSRNRGAIRRFWATLLVLILLGYLACVIIAQTEGFRYTLTERLSEHWAMPVQVERAWLKPDLSLVMENIHGELDTTPPAGVRIEKMHVQWSLLNRVRSGRRAIHHVTIHNGDWRFARDTAHRWQPAVFVPDAWLISSQLGLFRGIAPSAPPETPRYVGVLTPLTLRDVTFRWESAEKGSPAVLEKLHLDMEQARLLGQTVGYQRLKARQTIDFDGRMIDLPTATYVWLQGRPTAWPPLLHGNHH